MDKLKEITSIHNSLVRKAYALRLKSRERRASGLFVLEGQRELEMARKGGYELQTIFYCPDSSGGESLPQFLKNLPPDTEIVKVGKEVYEKIAYRGNTQGVMAIARGKDHSLENLSFPSSTPLVLVAEAPEKPGNIGALLRTADAAALDAVIIANPNTDLYNPNTIRSGVGCLFTTPVATASSTETIAFLKQKGFKIYCAALSASRPYTEMDFTGATAIVVGTESEGLAEEWLKAADQNIIIPMEGQIDSMNVSVSAAILIFEAKRQRRLDS